MGDSDRPSLGLYWFPAWRPPLPVAALRFLTTPLTCSTSATGSTAPPLALSIYWLAGSWSCSATIDPIRSSPPPWQSVTRPTLREGPAGRRMRYRERHAGSSRHAQLPGRRQGRPASRRSGRRPYRSGASFRPTIGDRCRRSPRTRALRVRCQPMSLGKRASSRTGRAHRTACPARRCNLGHRGRCRDSRRTGHGLGNQHDCATSTACRTPSSSF